MNIENMTIRDIRTKLFILCDSKKSTSEISNKDWKKIERLENELDLRKSKFQLSI